MAKRELRAKVIQLRLQGYTYNQIKKGLGVPKGTLSNWLRNLPLSADQMALLSRNRSLAEDLRVEHFRQTFQNKRDAKLQQTLDLQRKQLLPLSKKELFLAGVFLYWGEGTKHRNIVSISNTDPRVVQFSLYWMEHALDIPKDKVSVRLHLYSDMKISDEIEFWANILGVNVQQFKYPYIKKSTRAGLTFKSFGHGTCNLIYCDGNISDKIAMAIKAIAESYGAKSDKLWYN